jgi:P27 family predicted phage terminase small subunit
MARHKKPAAVRQLEGNRSRTPIPQEIAAIGIPEAPASLTAEQRDRWNEIVGSLPVELLSRADNQVLERMAIAWATFRQTCALINQSGLLTRGQNGEPVYNPLLRIRKVATEEMEACGQALGLSPLARTRLTAPDQEDTDPLTVLLGPHGKAWGSEHIPATN